MGKRMPSKEEEPKKNTTKRKTMPLRKKPQPSTPAVVVVKKPVRPIASLPVVPLQPPSVVTLVAPPKAGPHWWVVALCTLFIGAAAAIVGYVAIVRPFSSESTTPPSTEATATANQVVSTDQPSSAPPDSFSAYGYASVVTPLILSDFYASTPEECPPSDAMALEPIKPATSEKLHFDLTVSVEASYTDGASFDQDFYRLKSLVDLFDRHHLKATLYLGAPFTKTALTLGKDDVAAWAKSGHQVALAFTTLPVDAPYGSWLGAMHSELEDLQELCDCTVSGWMGGEAYDQLYAVAEELGLTTNVGWKNPDGTTPSDLVVVNPWTPKTSGSLEAMKTFDPFGSVVYLPDGVHSPVCPNVLTPFDKNTFTYSTKALYATMGAASAERVNVFRLMTSLEDFDEAADDEDELKAWGSWLTSVVDPLIKSDKLVASTDSATAEAFIAWLDENIGKIELK